MILKKYNNIFYKKLSKYIKKGDIVYLESDLTAFNKIFYNSKTKDEFIEFFFKLFTKLIGNSGNLIVPTFSYSWGDDQKQKIFDVKKTISKTGIFSEYLLTKKKSIRTKDPMFSFAIYGKNKKFFSKVGQNTFGEKSLYEKLYKKNAKLVSFGLNKFDPTFVHYVEQYFHDNINKIHYRYLKKISGTIKENKKKYKDTYYTFLRKKNINKTYQEKHIKRVLLKDNILKSIKLLDADIYIVDTLNFFEYGIKGMKKNKNFFIK
jgi:aminoglycoside 3-N-acetyltransferase